MIERTLAAPTIFRINAPTMQKRIAGEVMRELRGEDVTGWLTGGGNRVEG